MRGKMKLKARISHPVSRIILIGAVGIVGLTFSVLAEDWIELKNCRLAENQSNDADSFVVECTQDYRGEAQNRFRLYFVDAAETDANSDFKQERLQVQAEYWESNDPDFSLKMGLRAKHFVERLLRGGFSVYTQGEYAPSLGAPRTYALIRVKDRWLDEILVEEGLVRIYGQGTDLPDGLSAKKHWGRLHQLERAARADRRNGWHGSVSGEMAEQMEFVPYDAVTSRDAWIYSIKDGRKMTVIARGETVTVIAPADGSQLRIRFKKNSKVYEGLCEKKSLER